MDKLGAKKGKNIEEKKDKNRTKLENGFLLIKHSIIAESRIIRKKSTWSAYIGRNNLSMIVFLLNQVILTLEE